MLNTYEFNGKPIRMIKDMDGRMWWALKDLAAALQVDDENASWWLRLGPDERDTKSFLSDGGRQYLRMVNRDGVRRMLADSLVEYDFKQWANRVFKHVTAARKKENSTRNTDNLLTPTKIGEAMGGLSAQQVNQLLVNIGMQRAVMDFNKRRYTLTDVGRVFGVVSTIKKKNAEEVDSVLWQQPVINLLEARLRAEKGKLNA